MINIVAIPATPFQLINPATPSGDESRANFLHGGIESPGKLILSPANILLENCQIATNSVSPSVPIAPAIPGEIIIPEVVGPQQSSTFALPQTSILKVHQGLSRSRTTHRSRNHGNGSAHQRFMNSRMLEAVENTARLMTTSNPPDPISSTTSADSIIPTRYGR